MQWELRGDGASRLKEKAMRLFLSILVAGLVGVPWMQPAAPALGADAPKQLTLDTRFYNDARPGEVDGKIVLTIYPSGNVSGIYVPRGSLTGPTADLFPRKGSGPLDVSGGLKDDNLWLSIGGPTQPRSLHLTGTLKGQTLKMTASRSGPGTNYFESVSPAQTK